MNIETNMTPVQTAAHRIVEGVAEVDGGKVDLTLAFVPVLHDPISYTFGNKALTFTAIDYLPENAPQKLGTKGVMVKDNAHQRARTTAFIASLGVDEVQSDNIKSHVYAAIRAAVGIYSLYLPAIEARADAIAAGDEAPEMPVIVDRSEAGNLIVPLSTAFKMFDDNGEATGIAKVAFEEAKRDLVAEAKAFAKFSKADVVMPDEWDIWDAAGMLPVECSGAKQKQGKEAVSPYGDLPTNSHILADLAKTAVEAGLLPPANTRQGQTPEGDNSQVGRAVALLCKAMTVDATGSYPEAFTAAQVESFGRLGKLIVAFEKAEAAAVKADAIKLLAAAKEA